MKFTELSILKQIAISAGLAGLSVSIVTPANFHIPNRLPFGSKDDPSKNEDSEAPDSLKQYELPFNINKLSAATQVVINRPNHAKKHTNIRTYNFLNVNPYGDYVTLRFSTIDDQSAETSYISRFSLDSEFKIAKDDDVLQRLEQIKDFLTAIDKLADVNIAADEIFKSMVTGYMKALTMPEDAVIYLANVAKDSYETWIELIKKFSYTDFEYNDDTGEEINIPPIYCSYRYNGVLEVKHSHVTAGTNLEKLTVSINKIDKKETSVSISYNYNTSPDKTIREFKITRDMSMLDMAELTIEELDQTAKSKEINPSVVELIEHLKGVISGTIPFLNIS